MFASHSQQQRMKTGSLQYFKPCYHADLDCMITLIYSIDIHFFDKVILSYFMCQRVTFLGGGGGGWGGAPHHEPPHQDLRCLQIQLFSSLVLIELN